ncbi:MAG: triose-phosphate isomerase [bacterium]|nr:triose-phosphate isomerase [bacterium]
MKLVVANWKLSPSTEREAVELASKIDKGSPSTRSARSGTMGVRVVIMPPLSFLAPVGEILKNAELGSQDVFYESPPSANWRSGGAYTGEVSPEQLKSLGVKYVLVGHSERRALGETDEIVNKKVLAALKEGLTVVLCVGERERTMTDDNDDDKSINLRKAKEFVRGQLETALKGVLPRSASWRRRGQDDNERNNVAPRFARGDNNSLRIIIAYEPVWAISGRSHGVSDTPEDAGEMIGFIKEALRQAQGIRPLVLYGGSVNAGDARGFLEREEIDGVLVGSASLDAEEFRRIVEIARNF